MKVACSCNVFATLQHGSDRAIADAMLASFGNMKSMNVAFKYIGQIIRLDSDWTRWKNKVAPIFVKMAENCLLERF